MHSKYKKMVQGMQAKEKKRRQKKSADAWAVYILECEDGTFYTGIAKDLEARIKMHTSGKGARYTRTRLPIDLVYHENCSNRSEALVREMAIKALPRKKKEALIEKPQA